MSRSTRPILASTAWCRPRRAIASPRPRKPRSGSRLMARISTSRPRSGTPRRPRSGLPTSCAATLTRCATTITSASASTPSTTAAAPTCSTPTRSAASPTIRWWTKGRPIPIGTRYGWPGPAASTVGGRSRWPSRSSRYAIPRGPIRSGAFSFVGRCGARTNGTTGRRYRATWPDRWRSAGSPSTAPWSGSTCRRPAGTSRSSPTRSAATPPTACRRRRRPATMMASLVVT